MSLLNWPLTPNVLDVLLACTPEALRVERRDIVNHSSWHCSLIACWCCLTSVILLVYTTNSITQLGSSLNFLNRYQCIIQNSGQRRNQDDRHRFNSQRSKSWRNTSWTPNNYTVVVIVQYSLSLKSLSRKHQNDNEACVTPGESTRPIQAKFQVWSENSSFFLRVHNVKTSTIV